MAIDNQKNPTTQPAANPGNSTIIGSTTPGHSLKKRALLNIGIVILVIAACVGGYLYYNHHHNSAKKGLPVEPQTYSSLSSYTLPGAAAGQGMAFKMPADFTKLTSKVTTTANTQMIFLQHSSEATTKPAALTIGSAYAISTAYAGSAGPPATYLTAFNSSLKSASPAFIKGQTAQATALLKSYIPKLTISVQNLTAFTNSSIKGGAWAANFTADDTSSKPVYQGRLVYAATNNASYYFLVYTASYNWTPAANQAAWNQVFSSLKIDQ